MLFKKLDLPKIGTHLIPKLLIGVMVWGYALMTIATLFTSCIANDQETDGGGITSKEALVKVTIEMPSAAPKTYAMSEIDENHVETINVLAFIPDGTKPSGWAYDYNAVGTSITDAGGTNQNQKQFTVKLIKSTSQQTFVFLANVKDEVDALGLGVINKGTDKDELLERLVSVTTGKWNAKEGGSTTFKPFPMWGEASATINDATTKLTGISMLRSIARVDVILGDAVITAANFKLNEVYIYNSKNEGFIVPIPANISGGKATAASVPAGNINNTTPLKYIIPVSMVNDYERSIYLYEAKAAAQNQPSEATAIVVGGTYDNDANPTYYRLDFLQADKTTYRDILRNHHYRANIIKVSGSGSDTPDDAFNAKPVNIEAEIKEWDDGEIGNIIFDGQYYLGISKMEFLYDKDPETQGVKVKTDCPDGWKILKITEADGTTVNSGWLTTDKTTGTLYGNDGSSIPMNISVSANNTGIQRVGYVLVKAGRLEAKLRITQGIDPGKVPAFNFIRYTNVDGTGNTVPYTGGQIIATANTNMGWKLKTSIVGLEAEMSEPAGKIASNYELSIIIPGIADMWTNATTQVWIEYNGVRQQETTYYQGYRITITGAPATLNKYGAGVTFNLTGYFPSMNFRAVNAADATKILSNIVACTAAGSSSLDGTSSVTLTVYPNNTSSSSRNVKFQYEKIPGVWADIATVSQPASGMVLPTSGLLAPPGIIGIGTTTGRLTLDGSMEYPGGANEKVYAVYFKWGSMVAVSGTGSTPSNIAWVPPGFTATITSWANIPYGTGTIFPAQNNSAGVGDPCKLTQNAIPGSYRMPTGNPFEKFVNGAWVANYNGASGRWSNYGSPQSQFYPAGGYRDNNGALSNVGATGYCWSTTTQNATTSYNLYIDISSGLTSNANFQAYGFFIRCILE